MRIFMEQKFEKEERGGVDNKSAEDTYGANQFGPYDKQKTS